MRLDRLLANSGYGSRSEVKDLIRKGRVTLDDQIIHDPAHDVRDEDWSRIGLSGRPAPIQRFHYLMMDKPEGLITAMDDPRHRTIAELIPEKYVHAGLFPVGRLDRDTTGLMILTNEGTLGHRLASPRYGTDKVYDVRITGNPFHADRDPAVFAAGLVLPDGLECKPATICILAADHALLTIHEGKFHQVKRMMAATGRTVTALRRLSIGPVSIDPSIGVGGIRELSDQEVDALYAAVKLARPR